MKNAAKKGRSARNGNSPAPYTKYQKRPHRYSTDYYQWREAIISGKIHTTKKKKYAVRRIYDEDRLAA